MARPRPADVAAAAARESSEESSHPRPPYSPPASAQGSYQENALEAPLLCPACADPHRLLSCLWPCPIHGLRPCSHGESEPFRKEDVQAANPMSAQAVALRTRLLSVFDEPWAVPVNHEFGFREGRHTVFAPPPPPPSASSAGIGDGGGHPELAARPARLGLECTLFFAPGQLNINVGLYAPPVPPSCCFHHHSLFCVTMVGTRSMNIVLLK